MTNKYLVQFDHTIAGEPCQIGVMSYHYQPRWPGYAEDCPSDLEFYGYVEADYVILDADGDYKEELQDSGDDEFIIDAIKEAMGDA